MLYNSWWETESSYLDSVGYARPGSAATGDRLFVIDRTLAAENQGHVFVIWLCWIGTATRWVHGTRAVVDRGDGGTSLAEHGAWG